MYVRAGIDKKNVASNNTHHHDIPHYLLATLCADTLQQT